MNDLRDLMVLKIKWVGLGFKWPKNSKKCPKNIKKCLFKKIIIY